MNIPALVKVGLSFLTILALHRFKIHLGIGLFAAACLLGLLMLMPPDQVLQTVVRSSLEAQALALSFIIVLIMVLSKLMNDTGHLERIVTSFARAIKSVRVVTMVMPALIGLLPMPGGALFSAPMVDAACKREQVGPEFKAAVNYWFRHIWEYWWPLYPGVVLAISLLGVDTWQFMAMQAPLTLVSVAVGFVFLIRLLPPGGPAGDDGSGPDGPRWAVFRHEVRPITLVVVSVPAVGLFKLLSGFNLPSMTSVYVGLFLCLGLVIRRNRIPAAQLARTFADKNILSMVFLILGVMAFKGMLVDSRAVAAVQEEMTRYGIPPLAIIMLVPFLSGFVSGIVLAFVGSSFPLVVPLISHLTGADYLSHAALAYGFGYMGMMLSPIHICLLVTRDYFHADMLGTYRYLIWPAATFMAVVMLGFLAVQALI